MTKSILKSTELEAITDILHNRFGSNLIIEEIEILSEEDRKNRVARLFISKNEENIRTLIFKQSLVDKKQNTEDEIEIFARFTRELTALKFFNKYAINHSVPKFFGYNYTFRFILLEDLGLHVSLVDTLTQSDQVKALASLTRFTKALAYFHMASYERLSEFDEMILSVNPARESLNNECKWYQKELLSQLKSACKNFDLLFTSKLKQEVNFLIREVFKPKYFNVLTHGDLCPDNVFDREDESSLQLFDFEWVRPGSALLDLTYFRMNFPTCWCARALPEKIIVELETLYRNTI